MPDVWLEVARNMTVEAAFGGPGPKAFQFDRVETKLEWERGNPNPIRVVVMLWERNRVGETRLTDQKIFKIAGEVTS